MELERELETTRRELERALRALGQEAGLLTQGAMALDERCLATQGFVRYDPKTLQEARHHLPADLTQASDPVAALYGGSAPVRSAPAEASHKGPSKAREEQAVPTRDQVHDLDVIGDDRLVGDDALVRPSKGTVYVVAGDDVRDEVLRILSTASINAVGCGAGEALLRFGRLGSEACLVTVASVLDGGGLDLVDRLRAAGSLIPAIVITGRGDVSTAVRAMRSGVSDVIEEPIGRDALLTCVDCALDRCKEASRLLGLRGEAARHVAGLTPRQREIMTSVLAGHPSKNIAADLGISRRTVENHRASIMRKTGARSMPALARLAIAAESVG